MLVKDVGEFELIARLAKVIEARGARPPSTGARLRIGIGDDAAVWEGPAGATIATTDTMVEGVHFITGGTLTSPQSRTSSPGGRGGNGKGWIGWRELGWKSMASNLSDVAAMGGEPLYALVTLGLRGDLPVDGIVEMYDGMIDALQVHGGEIAGGDIVSSPVSFITVAFTGAAVLSNDGSPIVLARSSAMVGDLIAVTGPLGCSGGGLRMILEGLPFDADTAAHLRAAHYRPTPRVREGMALARHGVRCAMDISDGLFDDLRKLCTASGVGARVAADNVPVDATLRNAFPKDFLTLALSGGEDYELLFTAPAPTMDMLRGEVDFPFHVIGEIVPASEGVKVLTADGRDVSPKRGGWDHFEKIVG